MEKIKIAGLRMKEELHMNRSQKLFKNTAILSIGSLFSKGLLFIMLPLYTRWLTPEGYGIYDLLVTYITLLVPVIPLNSGEALFRQLVDAKTTHEKREIFSNVLILCCSGVIFFLAFWIIFLKKLLISYSSLYGYILFYLISEVFFNLLMFYLRGIKELKWYAFCNILNVIIMTINSIFFVYYLKLGISGLMLSYIISFTSVSLLISIRFRIVRMLNLKYFKFRRIHSILMYSVPLIPTSLAWWIMDASDRTIVTIVLGSFSNGILAVAHKIPSICQMIFSVFNLSWQESASESVYDKDRDRYYNKTLNQIAILLISIGILLISCNFIIFNYIFDKNYYAAYYQCPILIVALILSSLAHFLGSIYNAFKETVRNAVTTLLSAIINIIIHLLLVSSIGLYAATLSTLLSYLFVFVCRYIDLKSQIKLKINRRVYVLFIIMLLVILFVYINHPIINIIVFIFSLTLFVFINQRIILNVFKHFGGKLCRN